MISFADLAVTAMLRSKLPSNYTIVYAPPEIALEALARAAQKQGDIDVSNDVNPNIPPNTKDTIGFPGLTVYRTGNARNTNQENMPRAEKGAPQGYMTVNNKPNVVKHKEVSMAVEYTIRAFTRRQSEMNLIERELWFSGVYGRASIGIAGTDPVVTFNVPVWMEGVVYDRSVNKDTALVDQYGATATLRVETSWIKSELIPLIESISVKFESLAGQPLTAENLGTLLIASDGSSSITDP